MLPFDARLLRDAFLSRDCFFSKLWTILVALLSAVAVVSVGALVSETRLVGMGSEELWPTEVTVTIDVDFLVSEVFRDRVLVDCLVRDTRLERFSNPGMVLAVSARSAESAASTLWVGSLWLDEDSDLDRA